MNTHAAPPDYPDNLTGHLVPHVHADTWYAISSHGGITHPRAVATAVQSLTGHAVACVDHGRCWGDAATHYRVRLLPAPCRAGSAAR